MTQAPATPKARRLRLRATAALAGAGAALGTTGLAASEEAALRLRQAGPCAVAPEAVVFLIPLVGRHHVGDWEAVEGRLGATLRALLAQSDPRWRAIVCGQDRPALPDDPRIRFLPFAEVVEGNDKWRKLDTLCRALPEAGVRAGLAMSFDADDLPHRHLVRWMLERPSPGGWLVARGYVRNAQTGAVGRAGPPSLRQPLRKPFWKLCGSCAAPRFDLVHQEAPTLAFLRGMTAHEHRMFPYLARLAARPLTPLAAPAVLYEVNHGENFGARRGRVGFKTRFVERFRVTDPAELAAIEADFGAATRP